MNFETGHSAPFPAFEPFSNKYNSGVAQLVWQKVSGDLETPVSAFLKLRGTRKNCFLLESVEGGETLGRYSIIGLKPDLIWKAENGVAALNRAPDMTPHEFTPDRLSVFDSLKAVIAETRIELSPTERSLLPPMSAGLFGYFGYDMVRQVETLPNMPIETIGMPDAWFVRPTILAVFDNVRQEITFITPVRPHAQTDARNAYAQATARLADAINDLNAAVPVINASDKDERPDFTSNTSPEEFRDMVLKAKEYISAGDIFQVVLSQRFSAPFHRDAVTLYRSLRRLNPSPFLFLLDFDIGALIGSSPEILVRVRDGNVSIRPIAGTRARGATPEQDLAMAQELSNDPKELAEHLMLLDLGRNDVGKSSAPGTVQVTDKFFIERYSHVMHIVSNVVGRLKETCSPVEAVMNGFPAGTVSGAPKIRAMEIIDELEKQARGAYGGCIGYFSADGNVDTCIALRTAVIKDGMMHVQAGAGIVADSDPASEQRECENKAGALIAAAKLGWQRSGNH